ncbi:MAG: hypothetical protein GX174_02495 [Lentisphaerae bacterium]|jgi:hypothetical protein|nr:hypothetical protein [Lentisphaerota bacterium]
MARINYSYQKRQRELAKKRKKEEKRLKKLRGTADAPELSAEEVDDSALSADDDNSGD